MISRFSLYWRLKSRLVPGLRDSLHLFADSLAAVASGADWLDLGCGHQILPVWSLEREKALVESAEMVVGLDYEMGSLRKHATFDKLVRGNITNLPFENESFDLATSNIRD